MIDIGGGRGGGEREREIGRKGEKREAVGGERGAADRQTD